MTGGAPQDLAGRVIAWHARHGRHDLPWQRERTPYRVWLSEIMLQQTQVQTVIPYFERFVTALPDVAALAAADTDAVLHLWSGLGYYSRARNLHRTARIVAAEHGGVFPRTVEALAALPGIGRSTAGAIVALAGNERAAILDGNVKRVLARYHAVPGWPGESAVLKRLWALAESHLPDANWRDYTQALMDLGATLCTRRNPQCARCPLADDCRARATGEQHAHPAPRPRRALPLRRTCFLVIENAAGAVLLERRPAPGIWGGLWCFPEAAEENAVDTRAAELGLDAWRRCGTLAPLTHTFTHFRLEIRPLCLRVDGTPGAVRERDDLRWYDGGAARIGLSAPVARLLAALRESDT